MRYKVILELPGQQEIDRQQFDDLEVAKERAECLALAWAASERSAVTARVLDSDENQLAIFGAG
jgi:hypothetical protein